MFQSRLSDILKPWGRIKTDTRVKIGEPAKLFGLNARLLLRYYGLREVFRVAVATNCGRPREVLAGLDGALAAAREPRTLLGQRRGLATDGLSLPETVQRSPLTAFERAAKRTVDVVGSMTAILFLWPLFLIAAVAIKLDSGGPIIFRQRRTGFNAKEFGLFKFRTMAVPEDGPATAQACRGDLRATRVGKFLRRSSIDELAQLLNVLKGEMSLVGPRPHAVADDKEYEVHFADYGFRNHFKPGVTGWAQVNGLRSETLSFEKMTEQVKLDLWYIDNWSLGLDISILVRTCFEVLCDRAN